MRPDSEERLEAVEDELAALRGLEKSQIRLEERVERGFAAVNVRMDQRFDNVDRATNGVDWKTVLAVVTGITVPIVVTFIATGGGA